MTSARRLRRLFLRLIGVTNDHLPKDSEFRVRNRRDRLDPIRNYLGITAMTTLAILILLSFCFALIVGCIFIDRQCPTREDEEKQARRDMEEMIKRADKSIRGKA